MAKSQKFHVELCKLLVEQSLLQAEFCSAVAGAWSEGEQEKVNRFFKHWLQMLQDELKEKEQTIIEIMARLDLQDDAISERVKARNISH